MIFLVLPDYTEEDRLLSLARGGSQLAIAEIYELYYVPVYQFMRMRVADRTLAEDMTSEGNYSILAVFGRFCKNETALLNV